MSEKLDLDALERMHKAASMLPGNFALIVAAVNALPELLRLARRAERLERALKAIQAERGIVFPKQLMAAVDAALADEAGGQ